MDNDNTVPVREPLIDSPKGYALSGKIMLSAIVILFIVVFFMVGLHLYARWYLIRQRRRELTRRRRIHHRRTHIVFYVDNVNSGLNNEASQGLEPAVLNSLPVFTYSAKTHPEPLECAVCLSEFEESETGRVLPRCNHSFHLECIDMWFHSHFTCPLCRSPVEPISEPDVNRPEVAVTVNEPGSSSGLSERRKGLDLTGVRIEVPRRTELEDELEMGLRLSSPASQGRSPATRLLSLKRILSMNRKTPTGGASNSPRSCSTSCASGLDLESRGEVAHNHSAS